MRIACLGSYTSLWVSHLPVRLYGTIIALEAACYHLACTCLNKARIRQWRAPGTHYPYEVYQCCVWPTDEILLLEGEQ